MARDPKTRILITAKDEASGVFASLQRNAGRIAAAIAGYFGIRMFGGAISSAADFEEQMDKVAAITRAGTTELEALRTAADQAGTTTRYTATESAQALENLARAGFSASESVEALPGVLSLAQANGVELAEAAGLVTRAVRGMGLEVAESGRVADVLTEAAARANTTVTGLGQALAYAAPTAQALGLSLEDTVAIIGKFADAGIDASRAGTALNNILAQFSNPASKFRRELADAGITTSDFGEALVQLAGAGDRGKGAIIAVGQEAGPALRALLNQGIDGLNELRTSLENADGAAGRTAETMDGNLRGATRGFASAWDAVRRAVVEPLLEPLTKQIVDLAQRLRDFVSNGTASAFGEALRAAFQSAAGAVREFVGQIDFEAVARDLREFAERTGQILDDWGGRVAAAGRQLGNVFNGLNFIWEGFRMTVYAAGEAITGVLSNITSAAAHTADVFSRLTFGSVSQGFSEMAKNIQFEADALWHVSEEFAKKAEESSVRVTEAWQQVVDGYTDSGEAAQQAAAATAAAGEAAAKAGQQAELSAEQLDALGEGFEYVDGESRKAAEGVQQAANAAAEANDNLKGAAASAEEVGAAYERLGITSSEALQRAADNARRDFELIRDSGTASARDIERAFEVYAEKAIEANGGVANAAVQSEAAMRGLEVQVDSTGKTTVSSMADAANATRALGQVADETSGRISGISDAAQEAADKTGSIFDDASGSESSRRAVAGEDFSEVLRRAEAVGGEELRAEFLETINAWIREANKSAFRGFGPPGGDADMLRGELERILDRAERSPSGAASQRATSAAPTSHTVNINIGGRSTPVNMASAQDAETLVRELEQLERSAA